MEVIKEGLLKIEPGLMIWTIITFIVLLLILWKAAWKPIVEALDSRAEKIRGDIDNADKARQEAEDILAQHRELMDNVKEESAKIIARGKEEAERVKNDIIEKANENAKDLTERAKREIELAKEKVLSDIKAEIVTLSTDIAAKIINMKLNPDDHNDLVNEILDKIETVQ